jgi:hypothetical protein
MAGWLLDVLLEYLGRVLVRAVRLLNSEDWPIVNAKVLDADCCDAAFGCPVATVYYEYVVDGQNYRGIHKKPFLASTSGQIYAEDVAKAAEFKVRVSRGDPSKSVADVTWWR